MLNSVLRKLVYVITCVKIIFATFRDLNKQRSLNSNAYLIYRDCFNYISYFASSNVVSVESNHIIGKKKIFFDKFVN